MALLGEDGQGYDLARKLESCGVWRTWLGDQLYSTFQNHLSSPSSWEAFMRADDPKSRAQIQLQLRARALLFDKSASSLFQSSRVDRNPTRSNASTSSASVAVSKLSPNYLQLHGDDVYYTLEANLQDGLTHREGCVASTTASSKNQSKLSSRLGSRGNDPESGNLSQRFRNDELPETWYSQFIEKHRANYRVSMGSREFDKRTPEEMSRYLEVLDRHKRRRSVYQDDQFHGFPNSAHEGRSNNPPTPILEGKSSEDDVLFLPETMFTFNCVPDSALPSVSRAPDNPTVELYGVLDSLPLVRSPVMIERLGIMPECLSMEPRGILHRRKREKRGLGEDRALHLSKRVVARMLTNIGFEGAMEVPVEAISQLFGRHICKLGRILKLLADSYRKQCSAIELLKMFLQTTGYSNFGNLSELVKDGKRSSFQTNQQSGHVLQSPLHSQRQVPLRLHQQMSRQMHPHMQQMVQPQGLTFQQQQHLERTTRRQAMSAHPNVDINKERSLVQVKLENTELPMDGNALNSINARHPPMQPFRQQQFAAMSNLHPQSGSQFRQMASMQMPQMQSPNMSISRALPVKVEGFQELMGGDSSLKHDSEDNKLTSPSSK